MASACAFAAFAAVPARAADPGSELPSGGRVVEGGADIDYVSRRLLEIHQDTDRVVIDWNSFNIGERSTTEFFQPSSSSLAVNRVTGRGDDPTQILGTLRANGRVMILDRNGVIFGRNSHIDVGGIIASTGNVDNREIMSGADTFKLDRFGKGEVVNNSRDFSVRDSGLAALVAPTVRNNGVIVARMGKVALASGTSTTVDLYGDNLISIATDAEPAKFAKIEQKGTIDAEGGIVALTAGAARDIVDSAINVDGVILVSSARMDGGKIILSGGRVKVTGTLDASANNRKIVQSRPDEVPVTPSKGGTIDITAVEDARIVEGGQVITNNGGSINITAGEDIRITNVDSDSDQPERISNSRDHDDEGFRNTVVSVQGTGGNITIDAKGIVRVRRDGKLDVDVSANGGDIMVRGLSGVFLASASIETNGEGDITIYQNKRPSTREERRKLEQSTIQNAINAIANYGSGTNTVFVGAGDWDENVYAQGGKQITNLSLMGARNGVDARSSDLSQEGETVINSISGYYLDSFKVDGFYFNGLTGKGDAALAFYSVGDATATNNVIVLANEKQPQSMLFGDVCMANSACGNVLFGILAENVKLLNASQNLIDLSDVTMANSRGITTRMNGEATIANNDIYGAFTGIDIAYGRGERNVKSLFGGIPSSNPSDYGVYHISGNRIEDADTGMNIFGGLVDLTGDANAIVNSRIGINFAPVVVGQTIFFPPPPPPPATVEIPGIDVAFASPLIIDIGEPIITNYYSAVALEGDTLGKTAFDGITGSFVTTSQGALYAPGAPSIIDATEVVYANTALGNFTGVNGLTAEQLSYLEARYYHFNDENTLGLFDFGNLIVDSAYDIEDAFNLPGFEILQRGGRSGFVIAGLPRLPGQGGTGRIVTGGGASGLNNISPAAGGENPQDIEPASGGDPQEAACWAEAISNSSDGTPTFLPVGAPSNQDSGGEDC